MFQCFQRRKEEKPKEERIHHYRPQGEEFDKAYTYDDISRRTDDTETTQKQVKSEKITVTREDVSRSEEIEKPRYPKAIDVGRIVIDEIPDEKQPSIKSEIPKRDKVMETRVDIEIRDKDKRGPALQVKEGLVKVGRLNIAYYENAPKESDSPKIDQKVIYFCCDFAHMLFRFSVLSKISVNCTSVNLIG